MEILPLERHLGVDIDEPMEESIEVEMPPFEESIGDTKPPSEEYIDATLEESIQGCC